MGETNEKKKVSGVDKQNNTQKAQEMWMLKRIEAAGLVCDVVHEVFDTARTFGGDKHGDILNYDKSIERFQDGKRILIKHPRHYLGITWVRLYTKAQWKANYRKEGGRFLGGFVAEGRANCSELEKHYSKRKGRLIATGRALKDYDKQQRRC
ncbi:MAG: hypothetical protein UY48_C0013G0028 [Candidatus Gottesmanbacteria bacterium GW2011_GWB1_49_7]|uniref:Uncharacterized protein n=1 Tax=Candidatus Gottesmanbacteria bacterium GW2011_GWB1_49_7 TaxID=1618448 RepID=A0A0G1YA17_9BACT|nr:MAG: hypothetical protein UY48_C0013G0028 [Candidatus Gottesmanbacteria bacterium GW2011_GWB1_49_7]